MEKDAQQEAESKAVQKYIDDKRKEGFSKERARLAASRKFSLSNLALDDLGKVASYAHGMNKKVGIMENKENSERTGTKYYGGEVHPIGTKVKVTHHGQRRTGVITKHVENPTSWAFRTSHPKQMSGFHYHVKVDDSHDTIKVAPHKAPPVSAIKEELQEMRGPKSFVTRIMSITNRKRAGMVDLERHAKEKADREKMLKAIEDEKAETRGMPKRTAAEAHALRQKMDIKDALKSESVELEESRYPTGPHSDAMTMDAKNAYKHFGDILKSKGFEKTKVRKASAQEEHVWSHPKHGEISIGGWHGTGTGSRDYGGTKQIQSLSHHEGNGGYKEKASFMSRPEDGTEDEKGRMTEKGVNAHRKHISKITSYLHGIGNVKEEIEIIIEGNIPKVHGFKNFKRAAEDWAGYHTHHGKPEYETHTHKLNSGVLHQTTSIGETHSGKRYIIGVFNHHNGPGSEEGHGTHHAITQGIEESFDTLDDVVSESNWVKTHKGDYYNLHTGVRSLHSDGRNLGEPSDEHFLDYHQKELAKLGPDSYKSHRREHEIQIRRYKRKLGIKESLDEKYTGFSKLAAKVGPRVAAIIGRSNEFVTEAQKQKVKVSVDPKKIGYKIADIGAGGKEHNVKEVNWKPKTVKEEIIGEGYSITKVGEFDEVHDNGHDSGTRKEYHIHQNGKKVGELSHGTYFGDVGGKLHGKPLPPLDNYRGQNAGDKLHHFLRTNTGKKWASNLHKYQKEETLGESVDTLEEGRPSQRHPLEGHPYHSKSDDSLHYIIKDAGEAAKAMKSHNPAAESKYLDQQNDAATVLGFRKRSGSPDWYKKKYKPAENIKEETITEADKKDVISMDIPLLIRVLEYVREDIKSDENLHRVVERLIDIRDRGTLTMDDYNFIANLKEEYIEELQEKWEVKQQVSGALRPKFDILHHGLRVGHVWQGISNKWYGTHIAKDKHVMGKNTKEDAVKGIRKIHGGNQLEESFQPGDHVQVLTGKHKSRTGKVLQVTDRMASVQFHTTHEVRAFSHNDLMHGKKINVNEETLTELVHLVGVAKNKDGHRLKIWQKSESGHNYEVEFDSGVKNRYSMSLDKVIDKIGEKGYQMNEEVLNEDGESLAGVTYVTVDPETKVVHDQGGLSQILSIVKKDKKLVMGFTFKKGLVGKKYVVNEGLDPADSTKSDKPEDKPPVSNAAKKVKDIYNKKKSDSKTKKKDDDDGDNDDDSREPSGEKEKVSFDPKMDPIISTVE